jgi:hypothetical protein
MNERSRRPADDNSDPRLSRLYHEANREEPPAWVDATILAAARREVGSRPRAGGSVWRAWRLPVAIAAVIVLSMSVVTLMVEEGGERLLTGTPGSPSQTEGASPRAQDARPAAKPTPPEVPSAVPAPEAADRRQLAHPARPAEKGVTPAPAQSGARQDRAASGTPGKAEESPKAADAGQATGFDDSAAAPQSAVAPAESRPPASARDMPQPAAKPNARPFGKMMAEPEPPRTPAAPAASPKEPDKVQRSRSEEKTGGDNAEALRTAPEMATSGARPSSTQSDLIREYENRPPEKWLEKILELRRQGDAANAAQLLAEFRKRFPDHPVPAELR